MSVGGLPVGSDEPHPRDSAPGDQAAGIAPGRARLWSAAARSIGVLVAVIAVYYAIPLGEDRNGNGLVAAIVILVLGSIGLVYLVTRQLRSLILSTGDQSVRLQSLLTVAYLVIVIFALSYFSLARAEEGQFVGLETKTDSLYFTVTTLGTVGFGDVHAQGQEARILVTVQIFFDLVFVAGFASLFTGQLRQRADAAREAVAAARSAQDAAERTPVGPKDRDAAAGSESGDAEPG
jgi:hypothetical protein